MKTNISKALRPLRLPALALAAFLASCTSELAHEPAPGGGSQAGEALVTLRLQVPGAAAAGKTRAITAEAENKVDDLYILAFKVDPATQTETFEYYVAAKQLTPTDATTGQSTWTANLKVKEHNQTFVMVANAQGTNSRVNEQIADLVKEGATNKVGLEKMEVLKGLTEMLAPDAIENGFNATSHPLTMYGQTQPVQIGLDATATLTVALHRIVARVQVKFEGAATTNFSAEEVRLYNFNDRARVIPDLLQTTTDTDHEQTATIPDGAQRYPTTQDGTETVPTYPVTDHKVENTIYLFEAVQPADADHLKRPCLIVKGTYEGKTGYYRVDFATQDAATGAVTYMDIVRNHSYNITVTNVSGLGSASVQEALKNKAANITASMIKWNDNTVGNIEFEGDRVLGIATKEYTHKRAAGKRLQQVRATTNVKWKAEIYAVKADGTADTDGTRPTWIYFTDADGLTNNGTTLAEQAGTNSLQDVYFALTENSGTGAAAERKAIMRFTDDTGRLSVEALVVQNQEVEAMTLEVESVFMSDTGIEFQQAGGIVSTGIKFGPADVTLSWEIVDGNGDKIDFTTVTMDGVDHLAAMKGEVPYDANKETHTLVMQASELATAANWLTKDAKLLLTARNSSTGEIKREEIALFQKKYGLEIDTDRFFCTGQEVRIYVRGNMPWNAAWSGTGYTDAVGAGLIPDKSNAGSGTPSETTWDSYISIPTTAKPLADKKPHELTLTFTNRTGSTGDVVTKTITCRGGVIAVGDEVYEVYGPVDRTVLTKDAPYSTVPGQNIEGARIMTYAQATALYEAEKSAVWGICAESDIKHVYTIGDKDFEPGSAVSWYFKFSAGTVVYGREVVKVLKNGPSIPNPEFEGQTLIHWVCNSWLSANFYTGAIWMEGTAGGSLDVTQLGGIEKDGSFISTHKNMVWTPKSGSPTDAAIPAEMYGSSWEAYFNPSASNIQLIVKRYGCTSSLNATPYKQTSYPTFYTKLAQW